MDGHQLSRAAFACLLLVACGGGDDDSSSSVLFRGTLTGTGDESGVLEITLEETPEDTAPALRAAPGLPSFVMGDARGTIHFIGGPTVSTSGAYSTVDAVTHLTLTGEGYVLDGVVTATTIDGDYEGPDGTDGGFTAQSTEEGEVTVYCGEFWGGESGYWNLVEGPGGILTGSYTGDNIATGDLVGSLDGDEITVDVNHGSGDAWGGRAGASMSGGWRYGDYTGEWKNSVADCEWP